MGIIKRRPSVQIYTPRTLEPGQRFGVRAVLDAKRAVPLDWLDLTFRGRIRTVVGAGNGARHYEQDLVRERARLCERYELPEGRSTFEREFTVPSGAPSSYDAGVAAVKYTIDLHGSIPWWPDVKQAFVLTVEAPPGPAPTAAKPGLYSSDPDGPRGTEPHAEVSLDDTVVSVHDVVSGAVALSNVAHARYSGLSLALAPTLIMRDGQHGFHNHVLERYEMQVPMGEPEEGRPIPFRMRVPAVSPSSENQLFRLAWYLEVRASRGLYPDLVLSMPIVIFPARTSGGKEPTRRAPPTVGSERLARIWDMVASRTGLVREDEELSGRVDDVEIRLRRIGRPRRGMVLEAELRFPTLGLGLDGGAREGFQRLFTSSGVELGERDWDARHYLAGRDEDQVRAFGQFLAPALTRWNVADLDDEHITLEVKSAGLSGPPLEALARAAMQLAGLMKGARAAIPPPEGFDLAAWQAAAQGLSGKLENARMIVKGELEGHPATLETHWAEKAARETTLRVEPRVPIAAKHAGRYTLGVEGALVVLDAEGSIRPAELPQELSTTLVGLLDDARQLLLSPTAVTWVFPVALRDPTSILDHLGNLAKVVELASSRRGAYR